MVNKGGLPYYVYELTRHRLVCAAATGGDCRFACYQQAKPNRRSSLAARGVKTAQLPRWPAEHKSLRCGGIALSCGFPAATTTAMQPINNSRCRRRLLAPAGNRLYILAVNAKSLQWRKHSDVLLKIRDSFEVPEKLEV